MASKKTTPNKPLHIIVWQSYENAQFYTTIKSANHQIIFGGGEGYTRKHKAIKTLNRLIESIKTGNYQITETIGKP